MDFKLIILAVGIAFASCADVKRGAEGVADAADTMWKGKKPFVVTFQKHRPYCGGMRPSDTMADGITEVMSNTVFYIYEGERPASITNMTKVTTNEEGQLKIDLKKGVYSVIQADKALPLDEFIAKKKIEGPFYKYSSDDCFDTWRKTPDFVGEIGRLGIRETVTINEKCFTGDNPCMQYDGPYPP